MACVLVTGAAGFIGRALCPALAARGHRVVAGTRRATEPARPICGAEPRVLGDITASRDWTTEMRGIEAVVHLAQRAHRRADPPLLAGEPHAAASLARAAARAGAHRFVYVSSIKAMGEATAPGRPFRAGDPAQPRDAYGSGKLACEQALTEIAAETGLELVILRPPLVYGPEAGANFRALVRLAGSGLPLPFAGLQNRRSLLFVGNLADLLGASVAHPDAAGRVLLARDGEDPTVAGLIRLLARGQERAARLFPVPRAAFAPLPRLAALTQWLQIDDTPTRAILGWTPPHRAEPALLATARALARH